MSLISDALKKAQKLQTHGQAPAPLPMPEGLPRQPASRNQPLPRQIFALLALGAGALISLSVLATVYLLRRPAVPVIAQAPVVTQVSAAPVLPENPAVAPAIKASPLAVSLPNSPALPQTTPVPTPAQNPIPAPAPAPAMAAAPAAPPASSSPALPVLRSPEPVERGEGGNPPVPVTTPSVAAAPPVTPSPAIVAPSPAPAVANAPPAPSLPALPVLRSFSEGGSPPAVSLPNPPIAPDSSQPDPKIVAYIDALQITGIRMASSGNKLLMNDHIYRENETVDQLLGLRLEKIGDDTLTFVDEHGVIYTKNF